MNVNAFKSSFADFSRPNLFEVAVTRLNGQKMRFHCKAASLPGSVIQAVKVPYMGRTIPIPGDREYEDWSVTVMLDKDMTIRRDLYNWHEECNSSVGNIGPGAVSAVKSDGTVKAIMKDGSTGIQFRLIGLLLTNVAGVDFSRDSTNAISEVQATFAYDYFEL